MIYFVIVLTIVALAAWLWVNYDRFMKLQKTTDEAQSKLTNQLKARHEAVKKFSEGISEELKRHPELSQKLSEALSAAVAAESRPLAERDSVENDLGDCIGRLLQALQADEKLNGSDSYAKQRDELLDVEDAVTLSRQDHNDLALRCNLQARIFPVTLFVQKLGVKEREEFELEDVFLRYPLKIKATLPARKRAMVLGGGEPESADSTPPSAG